MTWQGSAFELVDTGGLLLATDDPLLGPAAEQAKLAVRDADLVLLVVDGRTGLLPDDEAIAAELRRSGKQVVVAVNKLEGDAPGLHEFARLGFDSVVPLSAEHGQGVGDLLDLVLAQVPKVAEPEGEVPPLRIALVGRPNVGKSSLLNRFLGSQRAVVSPIPGTTRDAVDSLLEKDGKRYLFVDTAGIRRVRLLKENVDHVSVVQARKSIDHADVAILVLDAAEGPRDMDATIGGYVQEAGRAAVIAVNKWDQAKDLSRKQKVFLQEVRDHLRFLAYAPVLFVSAASGQGLGALLRAAERVQEAARTRVTTGQLNRLLAKALAAHAPKAATGNKPLKILYGTQVGVAPPTFMLALNHPVELHFSYRRYLENQIRQAFGFEGAPLVLKVRVRPH